MGGVGNWAHHIEVEGIQAYGYGADQQSRDIDVFHNTVLVSAGTGISFFWAKYRPRTTCYGQRSICIHTDYRFSRCVGKC